MKFIKSKKGLVLLAVLVVAAAAAIGGYAYFSSTGSGSGTASVGTSSNIQLSSPLVGTLYPGGAAVPVTVTIHNPGTGQEYVGTISGAVQNGGTGGNCLGSWFTVAPITYNAEVAGGASPTANTTVTMIDSGSNQDACQGATMTINWSSN